MTKGMALRPNFLTESLTPVQETQNESPVSEEEKHLYALSKHAGWKVLNGFIDSELAQLDAKNMEAIASGMSFEQLGYNSVVLAQVKTIITRLKDRIKDAVEAIERPDGTQR
jgi:hypothetical protein